MPLTIEQEESILKVIQADYAQSYGNIEELQNDAYEISVSGGTYGRHNLEIEEIKNILSYVREVSEVTIETSYPSIKNQEQADEIIAYIAQEAIHTRVHFVYNMKYIGDPCIELTERLNEQLRQLNDQQNLSVRRALCHQALPVLSDQFPTPLILLMMEYLSVSSIAASEYQKFIQASQLFKQWPRITVFSDRPTQAYIPCAAEEARSNRVRLLTELGFEEKVDFRISSMPHYLELFGFLHEAHRRRPENLNRVRVNLCSALTKMEDIYWQKGEGRSPQVKQLGVVKDWIERWKPADAPTLRVVYQLCRTICSELEFDEVTASLPQWLKKQNSNEPFTAEELSKISKDNCRYASSVISELIKSRVSPVSVASLSP